MGYNWIFEQGLKYEKLFLTVNIQGKIILGYNGKSYGRYVTVANVTVQFTRH